ncbi:MAG: 50S ribosomal protein L9 [Chloroflexi bacterium]|nr:50S ribosomal protein L9 [Chloroflexota bacterium]
MKVILLSDVYKQGVAGEIVDVKDGYARNYLIPKKLAVKATEGEVKRAAKLREQAAARRAQLEGRLNELARQIDGVELFFERRASPTGKLFGSITTTEIADALNAKTGIDINKRRISQIVPRELGTHPIPVRLGSDTSPHLVITIVREGELANLLAARAAEAAKAAEKALEEQTRPESAYVPFEAPAAAEPENPA